MKITASNMLLMAGLIAAGNTTVYAQQAKEDLVLEEVLVTARKRVESLQDVSVAVSAVTAQALDDAHIRNSAELTKLVPSLTLGSGGGESFAIRGVGTLAYSVGVEPSVSTMIDGVVLGRPEQSFMQLVDIQRVEVLRGPQGSLFGKNSSAGVVHFITRDPSEEFEAEVSGSAIEHDEYRIGVTVSAPLTDTLGARLTYGGVRDDGYIKNVYDGDTYNGGDSDTVRFKLRWQPTLDLDFKWSSDYASTDDTNRVRPQRIVVSPLVAEELLPVVASKKNDRVNLDGRIYKDVDTFGHSLEVNWDIGDYTLTSISAYRDYDKDEQGDIDGRPTNPVGFDQVAHDQQNQFSQEFRIASPAYGSFHYVAGLYAFLQDLDRQFTRDVVGTVSTADFSVDTTNYAAFGEMTYELSDTVRAIAGGRYTYDDLDYDFKREGPIPGPVAPFSDSDDDTDFSTKLALEWDVLDSAMTYFSYAEGYKGQAYNVIFGATPPLELVDPETSKTYELGWKSELFERRVMLNAVLFRTDYDDFQGQTQILDGKNTAFVLTNAGEVRTQGLELDFTALASENLTVFGGVAFIDATIEDFKNGPCSSGQKFRGECPDQSQDLSDGDLPFSPDWKVSLNANYTVPLDSMPFDLVAKFAYQGQDDTLMDITQDRYTEQGSYHIFDLALTLDAHDLRWDATVYVKNVTDESYVTSIVSQPVQFSPGGYTHGLPKNAQRIYGVELRYRWF
jgi:iron complex outermembrane receptor protein